MSKFGKKMKLEMKFPSLVLETDFSVDEIPDVPRECKNFFSLSKVFFPL